MILPAHVARQVAAGKKTSIRRPVTATGHVRYRRSTSPWDRGMQTNRPFVPKRGDHYPVKSSQGADALCYVLVTDVRREELGAIDLAGAQAEGHRTLDDFKVSWIATRDAAWLAFSSDVLAELPATATDIATALGHDDPASVRRRLALLERLGAAQAEDADEPETWTCKHDAHRTAAIARFDHNHTRRRVWVIHVEAIRDLPRYLAAQSDERYTLSPARALEPVEAVDDEHLDRYATDAHARQILRRGWLDQQALDELSTLEQRLAHLRALAKRRGVDIRSEVRVIERRAQAIEAKIARQRAA